MEIEVFSQCYVMKCKRKRKIYTFEVHKKYMGNANVISTLSQARCHTSAILLLKIDSTSRKVWMQKMFRKTQDIQYIYNSRLVLLKSTQIKFFESVFCHKIAK